MPAKLVTYNSQNYADTLGSGLLVRLIATKFYQHPCSYIYHHSCKIVLVTNTYFLDFRFEN